MSAPDLFDPDLRLIRHARARRAGLARFLHEEAAFEVQERLSDVNRTFTKPAIVGPFADLWSELLPTWQAADLHCDNAVLPLSAGAHDLIISGLSLHHLNDPVGQLIQMARGLRPDGLCMAVMFGGQTLHELRACMGEVEIQLRGGLSPRIAPMAEIRDLGGLLQRAGLALPVADSVPLTASYANVVSLMHDLRAMGETNILSARDRRPLNRAFLDRLNAVYMDAFPADGGRIRVTFELIFLTGWAPGPDQQQPLKPGSATARLADALGGVEFSADGDGAAENRTESRAAAHDGKNDSDNSGR